MSSDGPQDDMHSLYCACKIMYAVLHHYERASYLNIYDCKSAVA